MNNFNWGHGITLFYIVFVATLAIVLFKSFNVDHSLVVDDYYAKDIAYQSRFDKTVNSMNSDLLDIRYDKNNGQVVLDFKHDQKTSGNIQFYRPSNKSLDFDVQITSNEIKVPVHHLPVGKWTIKVDWTALDIAYYTEQEFYF